MRLFITGISGLLGVNLALLAHQQHTVSGCYFHHPILLRGVETIQADLTGPGSVEALVARLDPEVIVHTAGLTSVDECEAHPNLARRLNAELAADVARVAARGSVKLIHLSSDHVFGGTSPWHAECEVPAPVNVYARTKTEAERRVLEFCPDALVIRTNFYGWGSQRRASFSDWILIGLREGRELSMFTDVFFTPILINDLVAVMLGLIDGDARGIFHVAGSERVSKFDFARRLAIVFGVGAPRIREAKLEDARLLAPRPKDMSLSTEKVCGLLGDRMPAVDEGLQRLRLLEERGWRDEIWRVAGAPV